MAFFQVPASNFVETPDFSVRPYVAGFEQTITGLTTMTYNPGCARSVPRPENIYYPPINTNAPGVITVDVSTVFVAPGLDPYGNTITGTPIGFGGCFPLPLSQTGLAGNDTVFPVYAIGDSTGKLPTTIIVPTAANFLPAGYTDFVRIGLVYIDGTTFQIIPWQQTGHYEERNYQLATAVEVLTAGAAGSATLVDLTVGDGPIMPGIAKVSLSALFTPGAAADTASLIATGLTSSSPYPVVLQGSAALGMEVLVPMNVGIDPTTGDAGVDYLVSGTDTLSLWVSEFTDSMGVYLR